MASESLIQQFRSLGQPEKIELLGRLWDEIVADPSAVPVSKDLRRLLDTRLAHHEASPDEVVDWADVKAEALRRLANK